VEERSLCSKKSGQISSGEERTLHSRWIKVRSMTVKPLSPSDFAASTVLKFLLKGRQKPRSSEIPGVNLRRRSLGGVSAIGLVVYRSRSLDQTQT
jgi:hypothetical protein